MPHHPMSTVVTRRDLLIRTSGAASAVAWWSLHDPGILAAAEYEPLHRYPRMVHEYFVEQVRRIEARRARELAALTTREQAEAYVQSCRTRIRASFGPEPERTPLNARVTGIVERDAYTIEKVIFESRPDFPVTANLYVPRDRSKPLPGVVGSCGHSVNGKAAEAYQSFAQGLARQGFVCLIFDPIGQGERLQYVAEDLKSTVGVGVQEHLRCGNQQFLVGEFFGMWRAWDGIRALDYLLTRPEVDPRHVGITGNSGGGTMTTWLCGLDSRWTMAAPSCFVTTFRRNLENELPADTEQCPPRALALGLDHSDFLAAMAPKPVLILAKERDYFDVRGSQEAFQRLQHLYRLLGAEDHIGLFVGPTYHGYSQENREAMYRWFQRATGRPEPAAEPALTIEKDETLQCTPAGQVARLSATRTVFSFTQEKSRQLAARRKPLRGDALAAAIRRVLRLPPSRAELPDYRIWRYLGSRGYPSKSGIAYAVTTEPGIHASVYRLMEESHYSRPPQGPAEAVLYVAHLSSDDELRTEPLLRELYAAPSEVPLFTCDVRGIGESQPETCAPGSFHSSYGNDFFYAAHSLMLDRPYLGAKTHDVLRVLDWLASLGHTRVHLVARQWGALPGVLAAVLSPYVQRVTLKHALTAFSAIAESEQYDWPLSALPANILAYFDLPDCYAALEESGKTLRQIDPVGAVLPAVRQG
ncbi:MAG: alpha/beta hydrolase family protein [Pirellulaceae bacterium]